MLWLATKLPEQFVAVRKGRFGGINAYEKK